AWPTRGARIVPCRQTVTLPPFCARPSRRHSRGAAAARQPTMIGRDMARRARPRLSTFGDGERRPIRRFVPWGAPTARKRGVSARSEVILHVVRVLRGGAYASSLANTP